MVGLDKRIFSGVLLSLWLIIKSNLIIKFFPCFKAPGQFGKTTGRGWKNVLYSTRPGQMCTQEGYGKEPVADIPPLAKCDQVTE